jgi:phenylpyruvate tautomerase PptA (4-oxalocrotonate tautomerase family)
MPTYAVTTMQGRLSVQQKEAIAKEITRIHGDVTERTIILRSGPLL